MDAMTSVAGQADAAGVSPFVLALREALRTPRRPIARFALGDLAVELRATQDSVWALIRRPGRGGVALRAAFLAGPFTCRRVRRRAGEAARLRIASALGEHVVVFATAADDPQRLGVTVTLIPAAPLLLPFLPRDLYPLGRGDDPLAAHGHVEAAQRGLNSGLLYLRLDAPTFGSLLYFQNLTAMNDYYRATGTKPDGAVGGEWPELGYLPPTPPQSGTPPVHPLRAGRAVTISDAILVFRDRADGSEREMARQFLQMLGAAYRVIDRPRTQFRDWPARAERTLADLSRAPEATVRHYGHRYAHPYVASEYPDIMVQMALLAPIRDWGRWSGTIHPLDRAFAAGLGKFYDSRLRTLRRYLPNVGRDKDKDAVDSWSLYHPLLNLARLARDGDAPARRLLLKSLDFAIKAARHFDYRWPIQFKVTDFSVITATANDQRGQTDVGGLYAEVMLQAHALTDDPRFLDEARAAIDAACGMRFNLNYQANLTAWGAAACMRLWRITGEDRYRDQSYVYLASFFHNAAIWESNIAGAAHYTNFLGVTCLQDAPYMAIYECFDSFGAFERYLEDSGADLDPAARMLVSEYCKYALDRAWFYYPDALPADLLATENRNGHIDRALSFPVEDVYVDGQPAGQVGQEIYGAGAALVFATRSFHHVEGAPFLLFCNHFIRAAERIDAHALSVQLDGGETCRAAISLVPIGRRRLPRAAVRDAAGRIIRAHHRASSRIDFDVPASGRVILSWR